ncbi:MAG: GNAT family N-acetyltransferase [Chthonomonadales bacterium]
MAELLGADIPADWPPESCSDALEWFKLQLQTRPDAEGWFGWYGIATGLVEGRDVLVSCGGYMGPPVDGAVEIGYSCSPTYYRRGYSSEMMAGLSARALDRPDVDRLIANVNEDNSASVGMLKKLGFHLQGPGPEPNELHFVITEAEMTANN